MSTLYIKYPPVVATSVPAAAFPLLAPNGSSTAPSYSFSNSTDTGMYLVSAGVLGFAGSVTQTMTQSAVTSYVLQNLSANAAAETMIEAITGDATTSSRKAYFRSRNRDTTNKNWYFGTLGGNNWSLNTSVIEAGSSISVDGTTNAAALLGTNTTDSAGVGYVGEIVSSAVTSVTSVGTSAQYFDLTSISLSPGDWDVSGAVLWRRNSATFTSTDLQAGLGTVTGNDSTGLTVNNSFEYADVLPLTFTKVSAVMPTTRVSISATATYYFKGFVSTYTVGTPQYQCIFRARRIR